jgi:CoA-transferase family III
VTERLPLAGATAEVGAGQPDRVAGALLGSLGAVVVAAADGSVPLSLHRLAGTTTVRLSSVDLDLPDLPPGTLDHACGLCMAAAAMVPGEVEVDAAAVATQLLLAPLLAAGNGALPPPPPTLPLATRDGHVWAAPVGAADRLLLGELLADRPAAKWGAAELAATAQSMGLPLVDFRLRPGRPPPTVEIAATSGPFAGRDCPAPGRPPLEGTVVVDLTAMWSGPLATWILATLGAQVLKVEPDCRLDGTRALDDEGVYPAGSFVPGDPERSLVHAALNRCKERLNLDLRVAEQRHEFLDVVAAADLVIANPTPRVPVNLGYDPASLLRGRERPLVHLTMPAFPRGSQEREWRAYGHGIHAVSGLGLAADCMPWAAPVPYCDALSGFAAAAVAAAALGAARRSWVAEVPMLGVAAGLASADPVLERPPVPVADLAAPLLAGYADRALTGVPGRAALPLPPIRGAFPASAESPAPSLAVPA